MARKRHLLEVLRERENRLAGGDDAQSARPPAPIQRSVGLPPMLIPLVGGAIVLVLLVWGGFAFFGSSDNQELAIESVDLGPEQAVLAVTYDGSRLEFAKEVARNLLALGYDAKLAPSQSPSGEGQLQLFVRAADASALESLLQEIRELSLEGQPAPFAGASLAALPSK